MNHVDYRTFLFSIVYVDSCHVPAMSFMFKMFNTVHECGLEVDKIVDLTKLGGTC